jgi:hypothetical protein
MLRISENVKISQPIAQLGDPSSVDESDRECMRFDMHLHSNYSEDSSISVKTIVQCYRRTGILPLVCDHNSISGSEKVFGILGKSNPDITCIQAEEILTSDGEIIGLFLQENIKPYQVSRRNP